MVDDICLANVHYLECKQFGGENRVTKLILEGNQTVPDRLIKLDRLEELNVRHGPDPFFIPWSALNGLRNLESLTIGCNFDLGDGNLNTSLPSLTSLILQPADPNEIPPMIISDSLGSLSLSNELIGRFPVIKGQSIVYIDVSDSTLSGTIPWQLGNLSSLMTLTISQNNQLTGTIPWEIGCIKSPLAFLAITNNPGLYGSIPPEFGLLSHLINLQLTSNNLNGTIPMELSFNETRYDQRYLWCFWDPPNLNKSDNSLQYIDLRHNKLSGTIPSEFGNLTIATLVLGNNKLTGTVPAELFYNTALQWLDLSNNNLTGTIPVEIEKTPMSTLILDNNNFVGTIPKELYTSRSLMQTISIQHTKIEGTIPPEIDNTFIGTYDLRNSLMSGTLPSEICNASFIRLNLGSNFWGCWYNISCNNLNNIFNCDAHDSTFGCSTECKSLPKCNASCNDKYDNITFPYPPSTPSPPSPPSTLSPAIGSIHSPSSLVLVIYRELVLKNLMTSLTSYFSNLTLNEGEILRIQLYVQLRYTIFEILGNLSSPGPWDSEGSTIRIGQNGTLIVGNWTDVHSTIQTSGILIVSRFTLNTTNLIIDNFASIENLLSHNSIFELRGGTLILRNYQGKIL
jgi:Leucine-rich repeat (LRR) protein